MEIFYHGGCLGFWLKKGKSSILEVIIFFCIFMKFDVILILCSDDFFLKIGFCQQGSEMNDRNN